MTNTWRDVVATALVAVVVVFYVGYLAFGSMPLVEDVRGMAAVGLICGFASRRIGGREAFEHEKAAMAGRAGRRPVRASSPLAASRAPGEGRRPARGGPPPGREAARRRLARTAVRGAPLARPTAGPWGCTRR
jgi:hypothetical protein